MSEQASLQERIMKARDRARNMARGEYIFLVVTFIGFFLYFALSGGMGALVLGICGIVGMILFTVAEASANKTKNQLITELKNLSNKIPTCPKCGKQLPEGNSGPCPFCGSSLTLPTS